MGYRDYCSEAIEETGNAKAKLAATALEPFTAETFY